MNRNAPPGTLIRRDVQRRFDRAAAAFDGADFVHRAAADGLLERLSPTRVDAATIVDLGAATGALSRELARRYRRSRVVSVDFSHNMLARSRAHRSRWSRIRELRADACRLPFPNDSVDLVCANLLLPWLDQPDACLAEVARILRRDGLFVFSSLGPDSLAGLRSAWDGIDDHEHVNRFVDMHDVGDALVRNGLRDPVLDVDFLNVSYRDCRALYRDLTNTGARNCLAGRRRGLTGRRALREMERRLPRGDEDGAVLLALELVYGHAWGTELPSAPGEVFIDASRIPRRTS